MKAIQPRRCTVLDGAYTNNLRLVKETAHPGSS